MSRQQAGSRNQEIHNPSAAVDSWSSGHDNVASTTPWSTGGSGGGQWSNNMQQMARGSVMYSHVELVGKINIYL